MISRKNFLLIITTYFFLGCYMFFMSINSPIVGIMLEKEHNQWVVKDFEYPELKDNIAVSEGDKVLKINHTDINEFKDLVFDQTIRSANFLTIKTINGTIQTIKIEHRDLIYPFFLYTLIPVIYFSIALFISIYLIFSKELSSYSLQILILFLLTIALAYFSTVASTRLIRLGIIINSTCIILSLVLLIHFFKTYYEHLNIRWGSLIPIKQLYTVPIVTLILAISEIIYIELYKLHTILILIISIILFLFIVLITVISYFTHPHPKIRILFWQFILPFCPFIFLYALPLILINEQIISASISGLFLLLIPLGFIFTQLTERLYDIAYQISRFNYHLFHSVTFTCWITIGMTFFTDFSFDKKLSLAIFICISFVIFLYIKENVDYYKRKVIFSYKGDYIHYLYSTIDEISGKTNILDLLQSVSIIIKKKLELPISYIIKLDTHNKMLIHIGNCKGNLHKNLDPSFFLNFELRGIKRTSSCYIICIHQNVEMKYFLILGSDGHLKLKRQELLWIELLTIYIDSFIHTTQKVEDLLAEIKLIQEKDYSTPYWLKKLVWLQLENEKKELSQELHDTILQEQIFLIRELDTILYEKDRELLLTKVPDFQNQLIDLNSRLRNYCERLKPPLLDTLGLTAALNKLFTQIKVRSNFSLIHSIDVEDSDNYQLNLILFRIIQELLNNAIKHSQATYVKISLEDTRKGLEIIYMDNGIGCDLHKIECSDKMGVTGIKEKVNAYNGSVQIETEINAGMQITIRIGESKHAPIINN